MSKVLSRKRIDSDSEFERSILKLFYLDRIEDLKSRIIKRARAYSREISESEYIGKPDVPFTPSLVGWAIINQINYKILKNERGLIHSSFPKRRED